MSRSHVVQVQAHGSDAMVDEENCVFFLPHRPRGRICEPPFFLFMKGTGKKSFSLLDFTIVPHDGNWMPSLACVSLPVEC